jgi:hypothetical protein
MGGVNNPLTQGSLCHPKTLGSPVRISLAHHYDQYVVGFRLSFWNPHNASSLKGAQGQMVKYHPVLSFWLAICNYVQDLCSSRVALR